MRKRETMTADPQNPNRLTADQRVGLAKSLAEWGDLSGITINRRTGLLIGGHQRADVLAGADIDAEDLATPEPDGTVARGWLVHGGRRYAVRIVDWPESKAHAAMLAANRFGRLGADDPEMLAGLLRELGADAAGVAGYTAETIAGLLESPAGDAPPDDTEPCAGVRSSITFPPLVWLTQRGQIIADLDAVIAGYGGQAEWAD